MRPPLLLLLTACSSDSDAPSGQAAAGADSADDADTGPPDADGDGATADVDCDDQDPRVFPGATEWCDGRDDDCDGTIDAPDAWWPGAGAWRVPVTLTAPSGAAAADVAALPLDLPALGLDPALLPTARLRPPGCDPDAPDLAVQVEDGLLGLLDPVDHHDPIGDGRGDLFFRWDGGGDWAVAEARAAWLTFGGAPAPAPPSPLETAPDRLTDGALEGTFDPDRGGMLDTLRWRDGPTLLSQAGAGAGNGAWVGGWEAVPVHQAGALVVLADGPLVAAVESTGVRAGLAWQATWALPAGAQRLDYKLALVAEDDLTLDHPGDWSNGVRPLQSVHPALEPARGDLGAAPYDSVDLVGAEGDALLVAWRSPPAQRPYAPEIYGGNLIVFGHDLEPADAGPRAVAAGQAVIDHRTMTLLPHDDPTEAARAALPTRLTGLQAALGPTQQATPSDPATRDGPR